MAIDLKTFSATKYKETIYQFRLTSYLDKYEDFEESDFIEKESKLFWDCLNAVDFLAYRQNMEDYHYLKHEVEEDAISALYPRQNSQVLDYIDKNSGEEKRLQKAFSLILSFLVDKEKVLTNERDRQLAGERKPESQTETKTDKLKIELNKYGFFELAKVQLLSTLSQQNLIKKISENQLPYNIAMFEFLGFIKYLSHEHFKSKNILFKEVARWFNVNERAVKGNINVLSEISKEDRTRYTADQQKQTVEKHYKELK